MTKIGNVRNEFYKNCPKYMREREREREREGRVARSPGGFMTAHCIEIS